MCSMWRRKDCQVEKVEHLFKFNKKKNLQNDYLVNMPKTNLTKIHANNHIEEAIIKGIQILIWNGNQPFHMNFDRQNSLLHLL